MPEFFQSTDSPSSNSSVSSGWQSDVNWNDGASYPSLFPDSGVGALLQPGSLLGGLLSGFGGGFGSSPGSGTATPAPTLITVAGSKLEFNLVWDSSVGGAGSN